MDRRVSSLLQRPVAPETATGSRVSVGNLGVSKRSPGPRSCHLSLLAAQQVLCLVPGQDPVCPSSLMHTAGNSGQNRPRVPPSGKRGVS